MSRGRIAFLSLLFTFVAATASANTGVPLFIFISDEWYWLVLIPIVLVEMLVARRIIGVSALHALAISVIANIASTGIGVWLARDVNVGSTPGSAALSGAFLMIPAFFLSVIVEWPIASLLVSAERRKAARRWSWRANLYTCEGMFAVLIAIALFYRLR